VGGYWKRYAVGLGGEKWAKLFYEAKKYGNNWTLGIQVASLAGLIIEVGNKIIHSNLRFQFSHRQPTEFIAIRIQYR
jgi:hypothetical protein